MIESLLNKIARQLDREEIPYMIIGGQAVLLYGSPRLTRDIDITLGVDTDRLPAILKFLRRLRLRTLVKNPEAFAKKTKVLPVADLKSKIRVDLIFSFTPYERRALRRVQRRRFRGYPIKFASCEDVIIHKLFAGRAIDVEDVKSMLLRNAGKLDLIYVRRTLADFAAVPGHEKILTRFNQLWKELPSRRKRA